MSSAVPEGEAVRAVPAEAVAAVGAALGGEGAQQARPGLVDMHCHLGFAPDCAAIAQGFARVGAAAFACTVLPHERDQLPALPDCVRVGVGLHPWWVAQAGPQAVEEFCALAAPARFVGEVGLDFGARHGATAAAQQQAFARVCAVLGAHPGKVASVHAVKSADAVLDALAAADALEGNDVILHWFSGTSQQLHRALRMGCWISLGELSLGTHRGAAYARQAAAKGRLLLETDWPPQHDPARGFAAFYAHLEHGARQVEEACGPQALAAATAAGRRLLGQEAEPGRA